MINNLNNFNETLFEFEVLPSEAISLTPNCINQAVQLSSQLPEVRQWQTYLNMLALCGFEQWLSERAPEISINQEYCSVLQPQYANVIDAVCNLRVGDFKLCLLATGTLKDEFVSLPRAAIDLPEYTAHFYVVLEVQEEQEQAMIRGFLRHDELLALRQSTNLQAEQDWSYELPCSWFHDDADRLLLYLRCLAFTAIPMPSIPTTRPCIADVQAELATLLPQLQPNSLLSQVLTWEQAAAVLTSPDLLNWLYQLQTQQAESHSLTDQLSKLLQSLNQQVLNVGLWLRDELDEFAQSLAWMLLPPPAIASLRSLNVSTRESPVQEFEAIIAGLKDTGMKIPLQARGAYRDLTLAESCLRLYVVTWSLLSQADIPEWTLLLVLGAQPGDSLPYGIKLQVSDETSILNERVLEENTGDAYLYTRVLGMWHEKFLVTIALVNGEALTLPAFAFLPN